MTPVASSPVPDADAHRLPRTVRPTRYVLTLEPDIAGATFSGEEAVSVEILEPVENIVLNALGLAIDEAWIERVRSELPELPEAMKARFAAEYALPAQDALAVYV